MNRAKWFLLCIFVPYLFLYGQTDSEFLKYFKKVKTIELDEKAAIKILSHLDIDNSGKLLITDAAGKVFLFSPNGKLIKELKSDDCHPGITWKPFKAMFKPDGEIMIINAYPGSMRFKNDGSCIGKMDDKFIMQGLDAACFTDGSFITFNNYLVPNTAPFIRYDKTGKELNKFGSYDSRFKNFIKQLGMFLYGNMTIDKNDVLYKVFFHSADIYKYDKKGNTLGKIFRKPDRYLQIKDDIPILEFPTPTEDAAKYKEAVIKFKKEAEKYEFTYSKKLFLLADNLLFFVYTIGDDFGVQIFNTNGKYLLNNDIKIGKMSNILGAKNNLVYIINEQNNKDLTSLTTSIDIYKYTGTAK